VIAILAPRLAAMPNSILANPECSTGIIVLGNNNSADGGNSGGRGMAVLWRSSILPWASHQMQHSWGGVPQDPVPSRANLR
jgi:hypothetical protein